MSVTLNGVSQNFKDGIVIKEKLNENLDEGMVVFTHTEELDIEPFDQVVITQGSYVKNMLVSDIRRVTVSYGTPKTYNYETMLTSPTIQLQRIVLPNRSVTQPLTGSKKSIYMILSRYVSMYTDFTISADLINLTSSVDCPEFQWNRPTLYEVINDLLSEVDAVVTMTSFTEISYLDLNTNGSNVEGLDYNEIELTQNAQDYANKIECEVENSVVNQTNTRVVEWVALKTDEDVLLTTDNAKIILEHSIDKINKVTCRIVTAPTTFVGSEADITSRVVEKTQYDLALTSNSTGTVSGNFKRDRLYYERGGNTIEGLCYNEDSWLGTSTLKAVLNVLTNAAYEESGLTLVLSNSDLYDIYMQVDYQTQDTVKFISNKSDSYLSLENQTANTLINNQDTSYVDFNAFARKQQNTVNRLGNALLTLKGKFTITTAPELGDYYEDYKVAERELSIYSDFVNFKGVASENYVLKDLFTGLKTQRRFTSIATESESLECNHIQEINFNLSKQDNVISIKTSGVNPTLENYMFKLGEANENIKMVYFKTDESGDIGVAPSIYWTTRSLILTWKMADNYSAGLQLDDTTDYLHNYVSYVDDNGNFDTYTFALYKGYDFTSETPQVTFPQHKIRLLPEVDTSLFDSNDLVYSSGTITRYKDNREITVETLQFNFAAESGIFYGKKFFSDNALTNSNDTDTTLYVAYSETETYSDGDQEIKGTIAAATSLTLTKTDNDITITSPDSSITVSELASWAICDFSGNIYIAVNN